MLVFSFHILSIDWLADPTNNTADGCLRVCFKYMFTDSMFSLILKLPIDTLEHSGQTKLLF